MKTIFVKPLTVQKKWYLIDAEGKELGRVAVAAARILRGKNKPEYVPHQDMGDFVIIINAEKAALTGNKYEDKMYYHHSNYPGGLRQTNYADMIKRNPVFPMEHAVRGMLPRGPLGRKLFTHMKVYAGAKHLQEAQQPITVEI
jgi:large subunit ribosomal protein L13